MKAIVCFWIVGWLFTVTVSIVKKFTISQILVMAAIGIISWPYLLVMFLDEYS